MMDGNPREELDCDPDRPAQRQPAEFRQKNRNAEPDRNGNQHRNHRCDKRAVDRGRGAELFLRRTPGVREQEADAEFAERRPGADEQGDQNAKEEHQNQNRRAERQQAEAVVREFEPTERARAVHRRAVSGARALQCGCGHRGSSAALLRKLGGGKRALRTHPRRRSIDAYCLMSAAHIFSTSATTLSGIGM